MGLNSQKPRLPVKGCGQTDQSDRFGAILKSLQLHDLKMERHTKAAWEGKWLVGKREWTVLKLV